MRVKTLDEYTCLPYSVDTGLGDASGLAPSERNVPSNEVIFVCFHTKAKKGKK